MTTLKIRYILFLFTAILIETGCDRQSNSNSDTMNGRDANEDGIKAGDANTSNEALGNAQDENMPNTMVLAAGEVTKTSLSGRIDGKIEASLELYQMADVIRGTITYKKSGKPIMVIGKEDENGSLFLREFLPDGKITGVLSGSRKGDQFSGSWYGNEKDLSLEMKVLDEISGGEWPFEAEGSLSGEYTYFYPDVSTGDPGAAGTLKVKQSGNKVSFSFDCVNGPPAYSIATVEHAEGVLEGNTVNAELDDMDCAFTIQFFKGFAIVQQQNGYLDCGFGNGAGIEGEYVKVR